MKTTGFLGAAALSVLTLLTGVTVWACGDYLSLIQPERELNELVAEFDKRANADVSNEKDAQLVKALRQHGRDALDVLRKEYAKQLNDTSSRHWALLNRVAGQYDAATSGLYWHTDLRTANAESQRTGRPILSLRMLGRLDEEYSCANSRFFREFLYSDDRISDVLRENFVLHWKPVCQVPIVTIDFGNGRKLKRPITGNSVHLVVDTKGNVIDALPGLVTPVEFMEWLHDSGELSQQIQNVGERKRLTLIKAFHARRALATREASELAIKPEQSVRDLDPSSAKWNDMATMFVRAERDANQANAAAALPIAPLKSVAEVPVLRAVQLLPDDVGRDTAFNLLALQPKIDDWFANAKDTPELKYNDLTRRIYDEVFLMPLDDPWLGLSPQDTFVALRNAGRFEPNKNTDKRVDQISHLLNAAAKPKLVRE